MILSVQKWEEGDTSSDPEMAVHVVVDGENEGDSANGYLIRLHRPASDFDFQDINIGNTVTAISHIQIYSYSGTPVTEAELQRLYAQAADWLGAFYPPGHAADTFAIDANVEVSDGHALIVTDTDTGTRKLIEVSSDTITIKDA